MSEVGENAQVAVQGGEYLPVIIGTRIIRRDKTGIYILHGAKKCRNIAWSGNVLIAKVQAE